MISRKILSILFVVTLLLGSFVTVFSTDTDGTERSREASSQMTLRCDTGFYPGDISFTFFEDVTGDGVRDTLVGSRSTSPDRYHLRVIDLSNGDLIYSYDTIYEYLNVYLMNTDNDTPYEIVVDDYDTGIQHT